jgi:hypothetical protein
MAGLVKIMPERGTGMRDAGAVLGISPYIGVLCHTTKEKHYDRLETDEFWTYAGKETNKLWLMYACHREAGEIVAYMRGK